MAVRTVKDGGFVRDGRSVEDGGIVRDGRSVEDRGIVRDMRDTKGVVSLQGRWTQ